MQNCPNCQMLMEDDELLCVACTDEIAAAASSVARPSPGTASPGIGVGIALLERPVTGAVPLPEAVRYRSPGGRRRAVRGVVWLVVLAAALAALAVMALRGEGPIAEAAVEAGLVAPPVVSVPSSWQTVAPAGAGFRVSMPVGAASVDDVSAGLGPEAAGMVGMASALGQGGSTTVVSDGLARTPAGIAALDDPATFGALIDSMVGALVTSTANSIGTASSSSTGVGLEGDVAAVPPAAPVAAIETMRRQAPVGNGRAVDVVVLDEAAAITTRARFLLADGRVHVVVTTGIDEGNRRLDEVHARVISTLETTV